MMTFRFWAKCTGLALAPVLLAACAAFRHDGPKPAEGIETAEAQPPAKASRGQYENEAIELAREYVKENSGSGPEDARLLNKKPYWFKEYNVYPSGVDSDAVILHETESRTAPYLADVRMKRQRLATRFQREKDDARNDTEFYRESGVETVTFEYRNGHWRRISSLFVVDSTEQLAGGQWTPVEGKVSRVVGSDSDDSWFRRAWRKLSGN